MKREYKDIEIEEIDIKRALRTDNGNIDSLTASIRTHGLLCPVVVDRNHVLISGGRRVEAARRAGLTVIPAIWTDIDYKSAEALALQTDENLCRLPLSSEEVDELIRLKTAAARSGPRGIVTGFKKLFHHD